jgi:uncharacterized OB-fold protein
MGDTNKNCSKKVMSPTTNICPSCGSLLEEGYIQAPGMGVLWTSDPEVKLFFPFSRKVEKLQKDWWGFPKLLKANLPAQRCNKCKLVIFKYSGGDSK